MTGAAIHEATAAFLLGFPALFSIVNPFNGALGFRSLTLRHNQQERAHLAWLVAIYSLIVMLIALWIGSFVLAFFGITVGGVRIAGGLVIALNAWRLLNTSDDDMAAETDPSLAAGTHDLAMVPLTIPLTAGPGTISVAIALGSDHPPFDAGEVAFLVGMSLAAIAMTFVVWGMYRWADRVTGLLGPVGNRTLTRLVGFLLLCIGVQIMIAGGVDVLGPLLAPHV